MKVDSRTVILAFATLGIVTVAWAVSLFANHMLVTSIAAGVGVVAIAAVFVWWFAGYLGHQRTDE